MTDPVVADQIIPTVGSSGYYTLKEPFNTKIAAGVRYTCQGVRRFSDYVAANEDLKALIYTPNNISDDDYNKDKSADAFIVSLQGETGHWLYLPARYIVLFPNTNGIPYRSISIGLGLPAIPANRDYSSLFTALQNVIQSHLGVASQVSVIETSKVTLVSSEKHDQVQAQRNLITGTVLTDYAMRQQLVQELASANQKIAELETYIKNNHVVTP